MSPFAERCGPTALVTGAAHGIGRGFARRLARRGLSLLLVDFRGDDLEVIAKELRDGHAVDVETLVADLRSDDELERVCQRGLAREIGLLVNNAGVGYSGDFLQLELERHLTELDVNARAPLILTHRLVPPMRERGRGGLIFTSSIASQAGGPGVAHYAATKAYERSLAEALYGELDGSGVDVLAVLPGHTRTRATTRGMSEAQIAAMGGQEPERVAEAALNALGKRVSVAVYSAPRERLLTLAARFLPRGWWMRRRARMSQAR